MNKAHVAGGIWGLVGISLILGDAIVRVTPRLLDALHMGLSTFQWVVLVLWCSFMLATEGYRGFQKMFSPRVAARMQYLVKHGKTIDLWLAPLFCMGYFHAIRKRIITTWTLTIGIILIILVVQFVDQPWRGIIDSGVVLGLAYGLLWVYVFVIQAFFIKHDYIVDPEVSAKS